MKKLFLVFFAYIFCPALICDADVMVFNRTPDTQILPGILKKKELQNMQNLDVSDFKNHPTKAVKKHLWQTESEKWYKDSSSIKNHEFFTSEASLSATKKHKYIDFLSTTSSDFKIKRGFLSLTKGPDTRRRDSIMFVFLMNDGGVNLDKIGKLNPFETSNNSKPRMHMLWTGSKKILNEQKMIDGDYPVDVSIANYDDGYASEEWNVVLPNKKPREVAVALKWLF